MGQTNFFLYFRLRDPDNCCVSRKFEIKKYNLIVDMLSSLMMGMMVTLGCNYGENGIMVQIYC